MTDSTYTEAILKLCQQYVGQTISEIFYYGSGCINAKVNNSLAQEISKCLGYKCSIEVQDDLLAVGRGLCQKEKGLVGILGTGSNIGYYDGSKITDGVASCGYLLGDEGSGFRIGQEIYTLLARKQLGQDLEKIICQENGLTINTVIPDLYKKMNPRKFLASFAKYIQLVSKEKKKDILDTVFDNFMSKMIQPALKERIVPVYLSGSIAFHFRDELAEKFRKFNNIASHFEQSPLEGLIRYHRHG